MGSNNEEEKVLQAVVLADSFNERFMPITLDRPRCLLPLVNIPIIEYTFEFLAISGVQEVILFCGSHADQIRQYINKSRWCKPTSTMHIQLVINGECLSVGDALRDIDARSIIHGDFILVCGDVVSNMSLKGALETHKARRKIDKNYIMTMVLKETSPFHRSRERGEGGVFGLLNDGECIAYEPVSEESNTKIPNGSNSSICLSSPRLTGLKAPLSVRYDLLDCQIDICSANVLALYTENFDYQDVRRDFLRGVLTSDILGVRVATHVLKSEYASRVRSPHLYDSISKDIIERWVFPVVPEADLLESHPYNYRKDNRYLGPDVILSKSAQVGRNVVLGRGVSVCDGTIIQNSVIGPGCRIGSNVILQNAYIWESSVIENACRIEYSIIADRVRIKASSSISKGCLITSNITLGPRAHLPPNTRIAKLGEHIDVSFRQILSFPNNKEGESESESDEGAEGSAVGSEMSGIFLGEGSDGVVWDGSVVVMGGSGGEGIGGAGGMMDYIPNSATYSTDEFSVTSPTANDLFSMGSHLALTPPTFLDELSESEEDDQEDDEDIAGDSINYSLDNEYSKQGGSQGSNSSRSLASSTYGRNAAKFLTDALDLMKHAIATDYMLDNAMLELNSLKFSCNATFSECRLVILQALLTTHQSPNPTVIEQLFERWAALLARFTQGIEEQIDLLDAAFSVAKSVNIEKIFPRIVPLLYKTDVLDEEAIVEWLQRQEPTQENSLTIKHVSKFVEWLQADDEEDEDEDEE